MKSQTKNTNEISAYMNIAVDIMFKHFQANKGFKRFGER